jgi:hypothetical protein
LGDIFLNLTHDGRSLPTCVAGARSIDAVFEQPGYQRSSPHIGVSIRLTGGVKVVHRTDRFDYPTVFGQRGAAFAHI